MVCMYEKCPELTGGKCIAETNPPDAKNNPVKDAQKAILEKLRIRAKMQFESEPSTEHLYGKILSIIDQINSEI